MWKIISTASLNHSYINIYYKEVKMKITNKKGIQLSQGFTAVLVVVLIAVLVIVGITIFESLETSFSGNINTVTNETGAFINATGYQVSQAGLCGFNSPVINQAINFTEGSVVITAANYTISSTGVITNLTVLVYPDVNLDYTFNAGDGACNASSDMITQFATYPALVGLVGTIVLLGLVIGVLVASFLFGGRRETV